MTFKLQWNVAHIYSQLAHHLEAKPAEQNPRSGLTRANCQERGVKVLRQALEWEPAKERKGLWREYIAGDTLLDPLRGHPGFDRARREYGK